MITATKLRDHATADHKKDCVFWEYECTCGFSAETERMLRAAAKRIDELEATARGYRGRYALLRKDEQS